MALQIDILYTKDCTGWQPADQLLRQALAELGLEAEISYWLVESDRQAFEYQFIGSPTIRVNGQDLFPDEKAKPALRLRPYFSSQGMLDYPTYDMILEALRRFVGR